MAVDRATMANAQGMLPPQNIEAEQSVLGSLLIDRDAIIKVAQFLKPEDFYREAHRIIYAAALDLFERKEPTDFVTLSDELRRRGKLEEVGGAAYLTALINAVPTAVHVEYYGRIVERCALLRRLIHAAGEIAALAYQEQDADVAIDRSEQLLYQLVQRHRAQEFVPIREVLKDYFDQIDWIHQHRGTVIGVPTGFRALDELTGGLQRSDLIIVAGRPSMGKTAFVLNIARNAAVEHHVPTAIFSLEMSREQLVQRLLCIQAHIDLHRLRTGNIQEEEWTRIAKAIGILSEAPIFIDDTAAIPIMELRTKARRLQAEENIGLIIIDYLQLMQGRNVENRVQEISEISRSLKSLARELNVPVVALSQLSRQVEQRNDHIPKLSDLRESGSIEQDADVVMFIYRDEMYDPNSPKRGIADIIIAKHRNGPVDQVPLRFYANLNVFDDQPLGRRYE